MIEQAIKELQAIESTIDFLHEILGCGRFAEITQTSDGFWLGRQHNDCGFNIFLGKPSKIALKRTQEYLAQMSEPVRKHVENILNQHGIRLKQ